MIGLAGGQLSGAYALTPLIQYVFDTSVVSLILAALPVYIYYSIRKNSSLDDTERRSILFSSTLFFGIFSGYLFGPRMLSLAPTTIFLPPFMFALLFDNGILPTPLVSLNRQSFFIAFASISVFITTFLGRFYTHKMIVLENYTLTSNKRQVSYAKLMKFALEKLFSRQGNYEYILSRRSTVELLSINTSHKYYSIELEPCFNYLILLHFQ